MKWTEAVVRSETIKNLEQLFRALDGAAYKDPPEAISLSAEAKRRWVSWYGANVETRGDQRPPSGVCQQVTETGGPGGLDPPLPAASSTMTTRSAAS
jgi:hypothetical protein